MRVSKVTSTGVSASVPLPVDLYCPSSDKGVFCVVTGAATYSIQVTADNIYDPTVTPTWFNVDATANANLIGATTSQQGTVDIPCLALRINQTVGAGSVTMSVAQQSLA